MKLNATVTGTTLGNGTIVIVLETRPVVIGSKKGWINDKCEIALADTAVARSAFHLGRRVTITIEPTKE